MTKPAPSRKRKPAGPKVSQAEAARTVVARQSGAADAVAEELIITAAFRRQLMFWLLITVVFGLFIYLFSPILLPFAAGMALAYFLDPVADWLERHGLSRVAATTLILVGFVLVFALALMVLIPILSSQLADFISHLPDYMSRLQSLVTNIDAEWLENRTGVDAASIRDGLTSLMSQAAGFMTTLLQSIWNSGRALIGLVSLFVVTPVVAFYMLLDWDRMVKAIDDCVPRQHVGTVRGLARDINASTAGFVRGQGTLCLVLGVMYAIGLTAVGLNFGLLIGLFAGLISFIPYVGSLVGLILAVGVAIVQFWPEWHWIVVVAVVFFVGQFIEGNVLQPRLVGKSVGLHPVWLMFALLAFGYLFGFLGLLIAVPAAAAIAVLVRFAVQRYRESPVYAGHGQG